MQHKINAKHIQKNKNTDKDKQEQRRQENHIEKNFLQILKYKPNPEFHHITLGTELADCSDYHNLKHWNISSLRNKARMFERRISAHRTYKIIAYPNGTVIIYITASQDPFKWHNREDWIDLISICGGILQEIKNFYQLQSH